MSNQENKLSPAQEHVLKNRGTEPPFSGLFYDFDSSGKYVCGQCGTELFSSEHKFESGSGWPSFYDVANAGAVELIEDNSHGMIRTEVICKKCGGHLGHVFDDGPKGKTGQRYCINSCSLNFKPDDGSGMIRGDAQT